MGKQKIVIKVTMENAKRRTKALIVAAGQPGVISAQIDGEKIVVIGDGIDSVALTVKLRKKMCFANLISVSAVEEKKKEKKEEEHVICPWQHAMAPQPIVYAISEPYCEPCTCCIM